MLPFVLNRGAVSLGAGRCAHCGRCASFSFGRTASLLSRVLQRGGVVVQGVVAVGGVAEAGR